MSVTIVDYGVGNVGSLRNMLYRIGVESTATCCPIELAKAKKVILPGVGAFDEGMTRLQNTGLTGVLDTLVIRDKVPILGICLGMQMMTSGSEEGGLHGLGWIDAVTRRFDLSLMDSLVVPHMSWNTVHIRKRSPLFSENAKDQRFYFVHSYHVVCSNQGDVLSDTHFGYSFTSAFQRANIFGVQFHPEKSHRFGLELLKNFVLAA